MIFYINEIYFVFLPRNIGDAVLSVQNRESAPAHLQLTELWDTQLPPDKLTKICKFLPKLNSLYTRASWLPQIPGILPPLTNLTADFDFGFYTPVLFPYLLHSGHSIRRLIPIDQVCMNMRYLCSIYILVLKPMLLIILYPLYYIRFELI